MLSEAAHCVGGTGVVDISLLGCENVDKHSIHRQDGTNCDAQIATSSSNGFTG